MNQAHRLSCNHLRKQLNCVNWIQLLSYGSGWNDELIRPFLNTGWLQLSGWSIKCANRQVLFRFA